MRCVPLARSTMTLWLCSVSGILLIITVTHNSSQAFNRFSERSRRDIFCQKFLIWSRFYRIFNWQLYSVSGVMSILAKCVFVSITTLQLTVFANSRVYYRPNGVLSCLHMASSHHRHYAGLFEGTYREKHFSSISSIEGVSEIKYYTLRHTFEKMGILS